ncbi:DUF2147 domain-containing protein [Piscinibacter terrae]|uniref:DUF2147 domain-containing protein n=1 Tax=Piscinibacter terrae TaxID=2496871 RepID=UPI0018E0C05E|nr:DUF2147 domain-containing protein [Albitalea terrae]
MLKIALATVAFVAHSLAFAQATPVGLWKTIDDDGKTEKSLVRISETAGVLTGKIEKILDPSAKPNAVCDECKDERAGKPLVGLTILRNLKKGDEEWYEGGDVTDPKNGKVYRAKVRTLEGGKQLQMRGYIGPFYRTQTWIRVE